MPPVTRPPLQRIGVLLFALVLALTSGVFTARNAVAAPAGTIDSVTITISGDSTYPNLSDGTVIDNSETNGKVGLERKASFRWQLNTTGTKDATVSQTLPEGWFWDDASLKAVLTGTSEGISRRYMLSGDGRTVTAIFSNTDSNPVAIGFSSLLATPTTGAQLGSTYTPSLVVTDGAGTQTVTASGEPATLTVVGDLKYDVTKSTYAQRPNYTTHDFGNGEEAAVGFPFNVEVSYLEPLNLGRITLGDNMTLQIRKPSDSAFTPLNPTTWDVLPSKLDNGTWTNLTAVKGATFGQSTLTYTNRRDNTGANEDPEDYESKSFSYSVLVPASEITNFPDQTQIQVANNVSPRDVTDLRGKPFSTEVDPNNNTVRKTFVLDRSVGATVLSTTLNWSEGTNPVSPESPESKYFDSYTGFPAEWPFTLWSMSSHYAPLPITQEYVAPNTTERSLYITGADPKYQVLYPETAKVFVKTSNIPGDPYPTGIAGETADGYYELPKSEYTVLVSTDPAPNQDSTWVPLASFTGDRAAITGVKAQYTRNGGTLQRPNSPTTDPFNMWLSVDTKMTRPAAEDNKLNSGYQDFSYTTVKDAADNVLVKSSTQKIQVASAYIFTRVDIIGRDSNGVPDGNKHLQTGDDIQLHGSVLLERSKTLPSEGVTFTGVEALVCYDTAAIRNLDTSTVNPVWQVKETDVACPKAGETGILFEYVANGGVIESVTDPGLRDGLMRLPAIDFNAQLSPFAPSDDQVSATIYVRGDAMVVSSSAGVPQEWNTDWEVDKPLSQVQVATYKKRALTSQVQRTETASYEIGWYNTQASSMGKSWFMDVLPYVGDSTRGSETMPRGTDFHRPVLKMVTLTRGAEEGMTFEYTTADPATIPEFERGVDPSTSVPGVEWHSFTPGVPMPSSDVTALRFSVADFVTGETGEKSLQLDFDVAGAADGQHLDNTMSDYLNQFGDGNPILQAETDRVRIEIIASTISGKIINDANKSGTHDAGEAALAGAQVKLVTRDGKAVLGLDGQPYVATTAADGTYSFSEVQAGDYQVQLVNPPVPAVMPGTDKSVVEGTKTWVNTFNPAGAGEAKTADIAIGRDAALPNQDFGLFLQEPKLEITKGGELAATDAAPKAGDKVNYNFTITNSGNVPLTDVALNDGKLDAAAQITWPGTAGVLTPGEVATATGVHTLTQAEIDAGTVKNTASAVGTPPNGEVLKPVDSADVPLEAAPAISITKAGELAESENPVPGDQVDWAFTIENTGNVTLKDVTIGDELADLSEITYTWPDDTKPGVLAPGQIATATANSPLNQDQIDAGKAVNTATAIGTPPAGEKVTATDDADVPVKANPSIILKKSGELADPDKAPKAGDEIIWTFEAENTGNITLTDVTITDDREDVSEIEYVWPGEDGVLAPGEKVTATATTTLTQAVIDAGEITNTATVTGTPPSGGNVDGGSDDGTDDGSGDGDGPGTGTDNGTDEGDGDGVTGTDKTTIKITSDPAVDLTKTAKLSKTEITYTIVVTNTGNVTLSDVTVSDPMPGLSELTITWPGAEGMLAPGESATAVASYKLQNKDANTEIKNTATVTSKAPDGTELDKTTATAKVKVPKRPAKLPKTGV